MKQLLDFTIEELQAQMGEIGQKPFRAGQIMKWLHMGVPFLEMTNLSLELRKQLSQNFLEGFVKILEVQESLDGTKKFLLELSDGNTVESVWMEKEYGNTVCVSTQVGCRMGCTFCASCKDGLVRNLSAGEILAQVIAANSYTKTRPANHVVLMGMGEPLDNYENVLRFIRLANAKEGLNMSQRSISLSTCGLVDGILRLAKEDVKVILSISLHAALEEKRQQLMPTAKTYKIEEILDAAHEYYKQTGRRVLIEYTVIEGFNDTKGDVLALVEQLSGMNCHVNLIPLNAGGSTKFGEPSKRRVYAFCEMLVQAGLSATVRKSLGADIDGACGQLRQRRLSE